MTAAHLRASDVAWKQLGIALIDSRREANAETKALNEAERIQLDRKCPFIMQGMCAVYKVQPLACRGYASLAKQARAEAAAGSNGELPLSEPYRMGRSLVQSA